MASHWYYAKHNTKHGPLSGREIKQLADSGELQPVDLIWKTGMADWQPARMVSGLFPTNQSKPADPPPIPTGNTSSKTQPSDVSSEERSATVSPKPAGLEDSPMNASEPHSTVKRLIGNSVNAVREKVAEPQTQNAIAKFKSFCGTVWSGSLNFWIRFSAWYLGVLRRIIHANKLPGESVATEVFPLRDVVVTQATDRATTIPNAVALGRVLHWAVVVIVGMAVGGFMGLSGGTGSASMTKDEFRQAMVELDWSGINDMDGIQGVIPEDEFFATFGQPVRTQTFGDYTFWYFQCHDGEVQVVKSSVFGQGLGNDQAGTVYLHAVNDY